MKLKKGYLLKKVCAVVAITAILGGKEEFVYAVSTKSLFGIENGYYSNTIDIRELYTQSTYENSVALRAAAACWEKKLKSYNSNSKYRFYFTYNSKNIASEASTKSQGKNVVAFYQTQYVYEKRKWRTTAQFQLVMTNDSDIIKSAKSNYGSNWRKSVFIHELGHALSLADLDAGISGKATGYGNKSIMSYKTDFKKVKEPTNLDVAHVFRFK